MSVTNLIKKLKSEGVDVFNVNSWMLRFFHPYTSIVTGEWFDKSRDYIPSDMMRFINETGTTYLELTNFFNDVKERALTKDMIVEWDNEPRRCEWDNKVAVTLYHLETESTIVLGWKDWYLCIGEKLAEPYHVGDNRSYPFI